MNFADLVGVLLARGIMRDQSPRPPARTLGASRRAENAPIPVLDEHARAQIAAQLIEDITTGRGHLAALIRESADQPVDHLGRRSP